MDDHHGMKDPLLNRSEFQNIDHPYPQQTHLFCQLCSVHKSQKQMYSVSQNCRHLFCLPCLTQQLQNKLKINEDMYCPIDHCPNILQQNSQFFLNLPNQTLSRFFGWKNSSAYLKRNQSLRQSTRIQQEINQERHIQNKEEIQRLRELQNHNHIQQQPINEIAPYINQRPEAPPLAFGQIPRGRVLDEHLQGRQRKQGLAYVPYTCGKRVIKFLYVSLLLPLMFVVMALLILLSFSVYALFIGSLLGIFACLGLSTYFLVNSIESGNQQIKNEQLLYSGLMFLLSFLCLALFRCFIKSIKDISYLIIANSWIWWIHQIIKIWAYPSPTPIVYLGPRVPPDQLQQIQQ